MEFGQHIITDERQIPAYPGRFNIESPYQFGLELWKATQLFDDRQAHGAHFKPNVPPHIRPPNKLIEGNDGQSLYLTDAAKNFRGKMPWGEIAEISAADVRGVTLDEMTPRVSAIVTPKYQAKRALRRQEELAKKARKEVEATATSPNEEEILAASGKEDDVPMAVQHNSNAAASDMEAVPTPMNGSVIPETASVTAVAMSKDDITESSERAFEVLASKKSPLNASSDNDKPVQVPMKGHMSSQAKRAIGKTMVDVVTMSENETNDRSPPNEISPKQNIVITTAEATSLERPPPAAPEPSRINQNRNQQSDLVAPKSVTPPEKETTDGDTSVAGEDSEDDLVFLGSKKIAKVATDPPEEPKEGKATGGRETRRSPRGGRGRWRYRYAN